MKEKHAAVAGAVAEAISAVVGTLGRVDPTPQMELKWTRDEKGQWGGSWQVVPGMWIPKEWKVFEPACKRFADAISENFPDQYGLINGGNFKNPTMQVNYLLHRITELRDPLTGLFIDEDPRIFEMGEAFASLFVDNEIEVPFFAALHNVVHEGDLQIELKGLVIRRLTDDEATLAFGGNVTNSLFRQHVAGWPPSLCIAGIALLTKTIEAEGYMKGISLDADKEAIGRQLKAVVDALRVFSDGGVVCNAAWFVLPDYLSPFVSSHPIATTREIASLGHYRIKQDQIDDLKQILEQFQNGYHKSLSLGVDRLSDAHLRSNPRDRLLDCVSGLESILLYESKGEKYRQEVRFRFATNYAVLAQHFSDRKARFNLARGLYDWRSSLAHGGTGAKVKVKVDGSILTLPQAAGEATKMLREVILKFIDQHPPKFTRERFFVDLMLSNE